MNSSNLLRAMKIQSLPLLLLTLALSTALRAAEPEKGVPDAPADAKMLAGSYYCGDGTGYNLTLNLKDDGTYTAEWRGCLGKYGEASGAWKLADKRIELTPAEEKEMMKGHLRSLDILKYKGAWIFVNSAKRDFYDQYGVSRYSAFQKQEKKKEPPSTK